MWRVSFSVSFEILYSFHKPPIPLVHVVLGIFFICISFGWWLAVRRISYEARVQKKHFCYLNYTTDNLWKCIRFNNDILLQQNQNANSLIFWKKCPSKKRVLKRTDLLIKLHKVGQKSLNSLVKCALKYAVSFFTTSSILEDLIWTKNLNYKKKKKYSGLPTHSYFQVFVRIK